MTSFIISFLVVVVTCALVTWFLRSSKKDLNVIYTRQMWENKHTNLLLAQMEIRKRQYESGGIAERFGNNSPQMDVYEDQFLSYGEEIAELSRRLSLPGLEGLYDKTKKYKGSMAEYYGG
jgi:hypothetical protein